MLCDAKQPDEKVRNIVMSQDILLTWCQTSGYLETLPESFTFHLGVWHCVDTGRWQADILAGHTLRHTNVGGSVLALKLFATEGEVHNGILSKMICH